jgi:predicted metal-dependent phosphoesterase TrpH
LSNRLMKAIIYSMLKADFHIHTQYSPDSNNTLEDIIRRCQETGIDCIAISDHGTTEGALKMIKIAPFRVVVAEEILTPHGEIMGMFLKETIPSGISVEEAIARIREQGGLVNIPHPFDMFRQSALDPKKLEEIVDKIDLLESFNARSLLPQTSIRAAEFAQKHNVPQLAGSDSHTLGEIGKTHIEMPEFNGKDDFIAAVKQGKIKGHRSNPFVHFNSLMAKLKTKF